MELAIGKVIRMPCMRRGLVAYTNETVNVTQESLEQLAKTAHGIPMVVEHPEDAITDENVADLSVGRVSRMDYDPASDLWIAEFIVYKDDAIKLLEQGWGVSTAWYGEKYDKGGTLNNVPYDRELREGRYEHLAIVKTPRYEMAVGPRFLNSRQDPTDTVTLETQNTTNLNRGLYMLGRVWKKITSTEEVKTNSNEELMVEVDGEQKPLKKILDEMKEKRNAEESKPKQRMLQGEDEVEVDGKKMSVNELIKAYKDSMGTDKKDEVEPKKDDVAIEVEQEEEMPAANEDESESEDEAKEKKKNVEDETDDEEKKKVNSRFAKIKEVHENGVIEPSLMDQFTSTREMVETGRSRYGSK